MPEYPAPITITFSGRKFSIGLSCSLNDNVDDELRSAETPFVLPLVSMRGVSSGKLGTADIAKTDEWCGCERRTKNQNVPRVEHAQADLYIRCTKSGKVTD
jgi:hypothetical protein